MSLFDRTKKSAEKEKAADEVLAVPLPKKLWGVYPTPPDHLTDAMVHANTSASIMAPKTTRELVIRIEVVSNGYVVHKHANPYMVSDTAVCKTLEDVHAEVTRAITDKQLELNK
jgi:hypothetical protein